MKQWRPPRSWAVTTIGSAVLLTIGGALALAALLGADLLRQPLDVLFALSTVLTTLGVVLLLACSVLLALRLQRLLTLRYTIGRDAVVASWRGGECVVPLDALAAGSGGDPRLPGGPLCRGG